MSLSSMFSPLNYMDEDMLALAEGVETVAELETTIMLGVDLIQGYYTARPQKGMLQTISNETSNLIRKYAALRYQDVAMCEKKMRTYDGHMDAVSWCHGGIDR